MPAVPTKKGYGHYPKSIGGRSPSLKWPHLYDLLRAKGYDKEKAARISNSRIGMRKDGKLKGLTYKQADNPKALRRVLKRYEKKRRSPKAQAAALVAACHSAACAPPPAGSGGSSPSGATSGRTPVEKFGMTYDPKGADTVASVRALDDRGQINWSEAEQTTLPASEIPTLHANERDLKQSSIDKVVSGKEPFREGYVVKLYETPDGERHVVDGHTRAAMYSALGKDMPVQIYRDNPAALVYDPFRRSDGSIDRKAVALAIRHMSKAGPKEVVWAAHHTGFADANEVLKPVLAGSTKINMLPGIGQLRGMGTAMMLGDDRWRPQVASLIAACYAKSCAPPPVGRGGSTSGHGGMKSAARAIIRSTQGGRTITVTPQGMRKVLDQIAGDKSVMLDLGKVHVKGTHLFARSAGKIDRKQMPQIPDEHRDGFVKHLRDSGIEVSDHHVDPKSLKPTQANFAGPKVGAILRTIRKTGWPGNPILVTSDGFILDGHHRWAASAMHAFEQAGVRTPVTRIDAPISKVLAIGLEFDRAHNIPLQGLED